MILLTRLNGSTIAINAEMIVFAEATPDTLITLANGDRINVRESVQEVRQLFAEERSDLVREAGGFALFVANPIRNSTAGVARIEDRATSDLKETRPR